MGYMRYGKQDIKEKYAGLDRMIVSMLPRCRCIQGFKKVSNPYNVHTDEPDKMNIWHTRYSFNLYDPAHNPHTMMYRVSMTSTRRPDRIDLNVKVYVPYAGLFFGPKYVEYLYSIREKHMLKHVQRVVEAVSKVGDYEVLERYLERDRMKMRKRARVMEIQEVDV